MDFDAIWSVVSEMTRASTGSSSSPVTTIASGVTWLECFASFKECPGVAGFIDLGWVERDVEFDWVGHDCLPSPFDKRVWLGVTKQLRQLFKGQVVVRTGKGG